MITATTSPKFNAAIDPYRVDIAGVTGKYVGETEKNLSRQFDKVDSKGKSLYFDEADALFGKRTSVQDAADRFKSLAGPVRAGTDVAPSNLYTFGTSSLVKGHNLEQRLYRW